MSLFVWVAVIAAVCCVGSAMFVAGSVWKSSKPLDPDVIRRGFTKQNKPVVVISESSHRWLLDEIERLRAEVNRQMMEALRARAAAEHVTVSCPVGALDHAEMAEQGWELLPVPDGERELWVRA